MNWVVTSTDHVKNGWIAHVWAVLRGGKVGYSWDIGPVDPFAPRYLEGFEPTLKGAKEQAETAMLAYGPQEAKS